MMAAAGGVLAVVEDDGKVVGVRAESPKGEDVRLYAKIVVGADGLRSVVSRAAGVDRRSPLGARVGLSFHLPDPLGDRGHDARMVVIDDGYVGLAPVPGGRVNVGIVVGGRDWADRLRRDGAASVVDRVLARIPPVADDPVDWPTARHCDPIDGAAPVREQLLEFSPPVIGEDTIAAVVAAWIVFRKRRPLVAWLATASVIGVVGEGILGGIVVAKELSPWLVVVHLGLAMIILGFLVATAVAAMPPSNGVADLNFRRLAVVAAAATYVMMLTGSTVVASGADESCNSWPLCGGGFALDFSGFNAYTMLHRGTVLVVGLLLLHVLSKALIRWRSVKGMGPIAIAAIAALVLQIAVGAGSAITGSAVFDGLHVALATLAWSGVLATTLLTFPRADKNLELSRLEVDRRSA